MTNAWMNRTREGFEELERFQSRTAPTTKFVQGDNGIQLEIVHQVMMIEQPADSEIPSSYKTWYSIGDKKGNWQIMNDGESLWHPDGDAATWVKSSKFAKLIEKCVELNSPIIHSGLPPTEAAAWRNLDAIWQREDLIYQGLAPTSITLPTAFVGAGQVVQQTQPVTNGAAPAPAAAPAAAPLPPSAPPSTPIAQVVPDVRAIFGANADGWIAYIKGQVNGLTKAAAKEKLMLDPNIMPHSTLMDWLNDESFFLWVDSDDAMKGAIVG